MFSTRARTWATVTAVVLGAGVGAAGIANAASGGSPSTPPSQPPPSHVDPARMTHGPGETLLTGSTAARARAAALAAVPGATVIRVETDSAGAAYEAHLRKSDGTEVTVKLNSRFGVTSTESGFGGPPPAA